MACPVVFFSCRKVINVDLNSADPRVVIEASISDEPGPYFVKLTKTVNFNQPSAYPAITGANVVLSDDAGNTETLTETSAGTYQTSAIAGTPGRTYTLSITTGGKTYTAVSKMNAPIIMDSLNVQKGYFSTVKNVHIFVTDPAGADNWYRFVETINDSAKKDIFITGDILRDGQQMEEILFVDDVEDSLQRGDSVTIALQSIDEGVYEYFRTLLQITGGGDPGSTPANPKSNFSNGALGYFSAYSVTRKSVIVR
jgi:hypothetical protein